MSRLMSFVLVARTNGRHTINDHMTKQSITEYHTRKSLSAQLRKELLPGGSLHADLGKVFVPSKNLRGPQGKLAAHCPAEEDTLAMAEPTASRELAAFDRAVEKNGFAYPSTPVVLMSTKNHMIRAPKRSQIAVAGAVESLAHELEMTRVKENSERVLREQAEKHNEMLNDVINALMKKNATEGGGASGGTTAPVPRTGRTNERS